MKLGTIVKHAAYVLPIIIGACIWGGNRPITHGPGAIAPNPPVQVNLTDAECFVHKNYTVKPLASFEITARVLSKKTYSLGRESQLSPVDLALGWGPMSDESVLDKVSVSQFDRWFVWSVKEFPVPRRDVERNSANMHMIPSTSEISKCLKGLKRGNLIQCSGYLVEVDANDGWRWRSSLTRNDTGQGACELVWVKEVKVL